MREGRKARRESRGWESWTRKKAELQRIDDLIVVLGKTLESPQDYTEIKPVNPNEIDPEYSLKELMLKLRLQYFGHLLPRADSLEKTLMLEKIEGRRRRGRQRMRWLGGISDSMDMNFSTPWETVEDRGDRRAAGHGALRSWTWLRN